MSLDLNAIAPVQGPGVWQSTEIEANTWLKRLPPDCLSELQTLQATLEDHPLDVLLLDHRDYELSACRRFMQEVKCELEQGMGLLIVDRLPVDEWREEQTRCAYWLLASMIARPVAQSFDGKMLYDVRDTGQRIDTRVRGDLTRQELSWHTDYGFNFPPPFIGLCVLETACRGGISRVASLLHAHNVLLKREPKLLARLYQPFYWNRQGEHPDGDPLVHEYPIYQRVGGEVRARFIKWLLYKGYELVGEPFDQLGQTALEALFDVLSDEDNHVQFELAPGQLQFMHNFRVAHSRSEYEDADTKRHLIRIFLRDGGRRSYMG